ncbi:MAG TPA: maleylpyruvate isomerase family mycothiol-dependent enzyme [Acidimicrobiales bacterium]|jgi:uncharacterized protein (TIGR03083 family)|nr:maleylpyruvate isomerase family mycothiol-dependent enzyme [Acidimicrobiales bacterium]
MALPRAQIMAGTAEGLSRFEELIRGLSDAAWNTTTRCEGWVVADVAAHVAGTITAIATGQLQELADPAHVARQVAERKGRGPGELADEVRDSGKVGIDIMGSFDDASWDGPLPIDLPGTLGEGVEAIWYDAYVHAEDINDALGRPAERGSGLRAAVSHIAGVLDRDGWGPATLAFDGLEEFPVGGGGDRIAGDPLTFVLVATGRQDPSVLGLDETVNIYRPR